MQVNRIIGASQRLTVEAVENVRCVENDYMTNLNTLIITEASTDKDL